jgi:hypothetical protein
MNTSPSLSQALTEPHAEAAAEDSAARVPNAWHALHERYQTVGDAFSARELARLRFIRWLYRSNRLVP